LETAVGIFERRGHGTGCCHIHMLSRSLTQAAGDSTIRMSMELSTEERLMRSVSMPAATPSTSDHFGRETASGRVPLTLRTPAYLLYWSLRTSDPNLLWNSNPSCG